jgi:PII-like signaling protein
MTQTPELRQMMRIYIGERNTHGGLPLYEAIVLFARRRNLAGASVFIGELSYGHSNLLPGSESSLNRLSDDKPVLVEIVDYHHNIAEIMPHVIEMMGNKGMITLADVTVAHRGKQH